ncbi:hypothetical protein HYU22_01320 [Candidatus Woesearchaeota archaeon]|nr:hypothetical protein [Candidatus Woesearchaeota archaeon]
MTQLQLDGPTVHTTYYGKNVEQMPKLLAEGKEPMSVAHLMEQRLAVRDQGVSPVQHDAWWGNYFDNADLWLRHPDKGGKVVPYSAAVLTFLQEHLKPETKLVDYGVPLPDGLYEAMDGLELKTADIGRLHSRGYTPTEAKKSVVWRELARTQKRLDNYVDAVVVETGRERDLMNTYFGEASKVPTGRLWFVSGRNNDSLAGGNYNLTLDYGRLVGVAPEAHVARAKK